MENLGITLSIFSSRHGTQSSNSVRDYSDPIPVDLLIDIFSRVPAKSIGRFLCVSKFWGSILQRPYFTELFLTMSLTRPRLLFAFIVDEELIFYSSPQHENSCVEVTRYHTSFPNYIPKHTCTGLVLLQKHGRNCVICNPITGESVTLPNVQTETGKMYVGYDPINKQFKVLCVTSRSSNTHLVLTLETGALLWRRTESKFHFELHPIIDNEVCINGVLYFGSWFQGSPMVACFEVRSEEFGLIKVDEDSCYGLVNGLTLVNYKGKLGVYGRRSRYNQPLQLVLWVLEDAGESKWSERVYELSSQGEEIVRGNVDIGMTDAGEIVFASHLRLEHYYHFYYSLERNTFTRVSFHGFKEFKGYRFVNYMENLKLM